MLHVEKSEKDKGKEANAIQPPSKKLKVTSSGKVGKQSNLSSFFKGAPPATSSYKVVSSAAKTSIDKRFCVLCYRYDPAFNKYIERGGYIIYCKLYIFCSAAFANSIFSGQKMVDTLSIGIKNMTLNGMLKEIIQISI